MENLETADCYISGTEICAEFEISSSRLCHWKKILGILESADGPGATKCLYSKKSFEILKQYYNKRQAEKKAAEDRKKGFRLPPNIEELKKQHPLVKNPKCFIEGWFPEV